MQVDAFLLGAPKCGTTSLASLLRKHPGVCFSKPKEPGYFCTDFAPAVRHVTTEDAYRDCFAHHRGDQIRMEGSTYSLVSQEAPERIRAASPDARCLVMLRDPVEMAPALHEQLCFNYVEDEPDFRRAWDLQAARREGDRIPDSCADPKLLFYDETCRLGTQLERLYAVFPRPQVLPILLDDVRADADAVFARVQDFLGLAPAPAAGTAHANPAKARRWPALGRVLTRPPAWVDRPAGALRRILGVESLGIGAWYDRAMRRDRPRPPLDPAFRAALRQHFAAEVDRLERLLERDLSAWR